MPYYFSGTNCRISGVGGAPLPQWVTRAQLSLGGEVVLDKTYTNHPSGVALPVMFDSSHFASGTNLAVKMKVWTNTGTTYEDTKSVPVVNKLVSFSVTDPNINPRAADLPGFHMSQVNYDCSYTDGGGWDSWTFLEAMNLRNTVVYFGHGFLHAPTRQFILTDDNEGWIGPDGVTPGRNVLPYRFEQMGFGPPPFNIKLPIVVPGAPPINFAMLMACNAGKGDYFKTFLHPHTNAYATYSDENQALVAFKKYVNLLEYSSMASESFFELRTGLDAGIVVLFLGAGQYHCWDYQPQQDPRPMTVSDILLYGDPHTRLKNAYTSDGLNRGWVYETPPGSVE